MQATTFNTKSGEKITVRLASTQDASDLLAMKLNYIKDSNTLPLFLEEYPDDLEKEVELIERLSREKNSALFVAECNGQLVGNIDLNGNQRAKLFHTGVIGMGLEEKWRGKGIGSALMQAIIDWSTKNQFISILWLEVYDSNNAGKKLYEKMGFKVCGRIDNFFHEDDEKIDKITMVRHL